MVTNPDKNQTSHPRHARRRSPSPQPLTNASHRLSLHQKIRRPSQQPKNQRQVSAVVSSVPITKRVYLLDMENIKKTEVSMKEFIYVDASKVKNNVKPAADETEQPPKKPPWVPDNIDAHSWRLDPPCYSQKPVYYTMHELETKGYQLTYNPMADYSLEIIRQYRPDMYSGIFRVFRLWTRHHYSSQQLNEINALLDPARVHVEDFQAHFSPTSPVAAALGAATLSEDILPCIEHYLALIALKAYCFRDLLSRIK